MAKPWDDSLKKLVHADPQAFVSWFVPGASFIGARPHELKNWTLEVDALSSITRALNWELSLPKSSCTQAKLDCCHCCH